MIKYETNSKLVQPGQIFVAIKGHTVDGHDFIPEAIKRGAIKAIVDHQTNDDIEELIVPDTKAYLNEQIVKEYAKEFKDIKFIGVTGTNGKTTTCYLVYQLLRLFGKNVAYLGTIGFYHGDYYQELDNTTPDILTLYKMLFIAKKGGVKYIVMEVSSHSLALDRVAGLAFTIGGFTNLTQDHLDFHETMENYLQAKLKMIGYLNGHGKMILNADDKASKAFLKLAPAKTVGLKGSYQINKYTFSTDTTTIKFTYRKKEYVVTTNLTSHFNVYNYLMALAIMQTLGFKIEDIIYHTKDIYPPKGRCETIKVKEGLAVVDFAHTPDAVEKVIDAYNENKPARLITLVGCGGDRDPKKRPIMGRIATDKSDYVIFTSDNPRTEDPEAILADIIKDNHATNYETIVDRRAAIKRGIDLLEPGDILLLLGKGHENYQIIGHEKHHFDDAEEVKNY